MLGDRDEGEDALQQVFVKAHRALRAGTEPLALRPWLYGIARNCCLSAIAARRRSEPLGDGAQVFAGMSDAVIQREDLRELSRRSGGCPRTSAAPFCSRSSAISATKLSPRSWAVL